VVSERANFLVVLERSDALTWLSLRNAVEVHIVAVDQLNTYDVLASDDVVFTRGAYDTFVGGNGSAGAEVVTVEVPEKPAKDTRKAAKPAKAKKAETPAATATDTEAPAEAQAEVETEDASDKPELPKGAKAPLKSGGAPKGYPVKGTTDAGLYHEPDTEGYDDAEAEFYFKSVEDAEAAGLTRAGGEKKGDDE
jgi:large subunit ribosomal protein L4